MYCIGLTGSIASGKSTVAAHFAELGIDVISADHIARELVKRNQPALQHIINHFGNAILTADGELNRRYLRELIVHNIDDRRWLENLLHPLIRERIQQDIHQCKRPYCIIEIPLLTDKSNYPYLNRVLLVTADPEQQITRIMARDHSSREQASNILATTRADENKRRAIADDVLVNDGGVDALRQQVEMLHTQYIHDVRGTKNCATSASVSPTPPSV